MNKPDFDSPEWKEFARKRPPEEVAQMVESLVAPSLPDETLPSFTRNFGTRIITWCSVILVIGFVLLVSSWFMPITPFHFPAAPPPGAATAVVPETPPAQTTSPETTAAAVITTPQIILSGGQPAPPSLYTAKLSSPWEMRFQLLDARSRERKTGNAFHPYTYAITGRIRNFSAKPYGRVSIVFGLTDREGKTIGSARDDLDAVQPGETRDFEAPVEEDAAITAWLQEISWND